GQGRTDRRDLRGGPFGHLVLLPTDTVRASPPRRETVATDAYLGRRHGGKWAREASRALQGSFPASRTGVYPGIAGGCSICFYMGSAAAASAARDPRPGRAAINASSRRWCVGSRWSIEAYARPRPNVRSCI